MIQIVSPHIDDAFLSLGGNILKWINRGEAVRVFNVFTISNWVSEANLSGKKYPKDQVIISAVRKQEEALLSDQIGYSYECWDFLDKPLRTGFLPDQIESMTRTIAAKILENVRPGHPVFFPLGLAHEDHMLIKEISHEVMNNFLETYYYEDLPHLCSIDRDFCELFSSAVRGKSFVTERIDFATKAALLKTYGSQVEPSWLELMKNYSYNICDNHYYERYWK
jgi:LmbE family N-acetylglucosaminyl deacetylase